MTMIRIRTLRTDDVTFMLRRALGPARNWSDYLADCIRGRADFHGLQLLPVGYVKSIKGRCSRPVYSASEVAAFIAEARFRNPPATNPAQLVFREMLIDTATLNLPPRMRRAIPCTPEPIA